MTNLRRATDDEIARWHDLLATNPAGGETLQTRAFAEVKSRHGWRAEFMVYETSFGLIYALFLIKKIPRLGRVIYAPRGPSVANMKQWLEICQINRKFLTDAVIVKMEPPILKNTLKNLPDDIKKTGDIQGHLVSTTILDLDQEQEKLLASFRQRARRSIRGGKKERLHVVDAGFSDEAVNWMRQLHAETARRANLKIRPKRYYRKFWRSFCEHDMGRFFFVFAPDDPLPIAGAFICFVGDYALYKDGGSRRDTVFHFSHLLHWKIMQWLHSRNIKKYDLDGTPPSDRLDDPTHRLHSLATFKMSFGGEVTDFIGTYDQILAPNHYQKWQRIEKISTKILIHTPRRGVY
ncbi:MAG: peptidoglycan bridge formation glycyltransferase FemA/FemB family protein [Candidatus Nomurabacteria bacterium]|jgi:lipid II:glycine glycyltransferase (peptidoglycan interpeptide bridge formation enzyme)|nr:peptidoglycan bridge formation glycyltransferase FemA/FemB family protein [Candidatus Nomurabacteria bacterium]